MDALAPVGTPGRRFRCKCVLLYWTGDYPAQATISGTHSKCCHWCRHKSSPAPEISRRFWGDYRRYLPGGHALRLASARYGPEEPRNPPDIRTHDGFVQDAKANLAHVIKLRNPNARKNKVYKKDLPYKSTGGCYACIFYIPTSIFRHLIMLTYFRRRFCSAPSFYRRFSFCFLTVVVPCRLLFVYRLAYCVYRCQGVLAADAFAPV